MKSIQGNIYVVGDNIDTDQIIPAQYLNLVPTIPEEYRKLGSYALCGLPDEYPPFVKPGAARSDFTIVLAGRNFGCGSSREHAPIALGAAGVMAVVAQSYARIFFRNAVATGELYPFETPENLRDCFRTGDPAAIDAAGASLVNQRTGKTFPLSPLGAVAPVVEAGGIFAYARKSGMLK
jgi:3-isopropylmalate/(R)-2-methylmalate dehydratase small subunit